MTELAAAFDVPVLFDAAHALGAVAGGTPVGGFGAAEVFSLTPTKVLVAGEGGLVATNDDALADRIRIGRDYGNPGNYDTQFVGLNARMSEFHAAMALESLRKFAGSLERRRYLAGLYRTHLEEIPGIGFQEVPAGDVSTFKDFTITVDPEQFGLTRDGLAHALKAEGIDTRKYFDPPVHRQFATGISRPSPSRRPTRSPRACCRFRCSPTFATSTSSASPTGSARCTRTPPSSKPGATRRIPTRALRCSASADTAHPRQPVTLGRSRRRDTGGSGTGTSRALALTEWTSWASGVDRPRIEFTGDDGTSADNTTFRNRHTR